MFLIEKNTINLPDLLIGCHLLTVKLSSEALERESSSTSSDHGRLAMSRVPTPPPPEMSCPVAENWCYTQVRLFSPNSDKTFHRYTYMDQKSCIWSLWSEVVILLTLYSRDHKFDPVSLQSFRWESKLSYHPDMAWADGRM